MKIVSPPRKLLTEFCALSMKILRLANRGVSRIEFLREVSKMLIHFSGCDALVIRKKDRDYNYYWEAKIQPQEVFHFKKHEDTPLSSTCESDMERFYRELSQGHFDPRLPFFTKHGSFWTGNADQPVTFTSKKDEKKRSYRLKAGEYKSLLLIPLVVDGKNQGLLEYKSKKPHFFHEQEIEFYEGVAQTFEAAVSDRRAQAALRERVKELACLYEISRITQHPSTSLEEIFQHIAELLPRAFQYPEIAAASILLDGHTYLSPGFRKGNYNLKAEIFANGKSRGFVEVLYQAGNFGLEEEPFLKEEQSLLDGVAKQVSLIIEGKKAEEDKQKLQNQLRHADRLATIGELAAGVAHELNEPLGNILGFAQLAKKSPDLPKQTEKDLDKIVGASLHAREVVKKLLIFARQMPAQKTRANLNQIVNDGLYFLESRCSKEGIELRRHLSTDLPDIIADPAQINQVLINLVVNSIQAMPEGGILTVRTRAYSNHVSLIVEDTGVGMSEEVKKQIFIPFFTTKEIGRGTGLGLPVVHGIVTSHGGSIQVDSEKGRGTRFEIELPLTEVQDVVENH